MFDHVRLICFDLDDTLWPCAPVIQAAEAECHAWLAEAAPRITAHYGPAQLREHRLALAHREPLIAHDLTEVRRRSLAELLVAHGYDAALAGQASDVFRAARNRVSPYDDVADALAALRSRYLLVSVTNGNAQVEHTPLHAHFDYRFSAADVGAAKPDPAMFHAASRASGVPLNAMLHVGDDPERDVQAARAQGMRTVWVNRDSRVWPPDLPPADLEVRVLHTLVNRLV